MRARMRDCEEKATRALCQYKFWMFGYWAAAWVQLNRLQPREDRMANPFRPLVKAAHELRDAKYETATDPKLKGKKP